MFDDEVPDIKRTIRAPAKTQETFTCNRVDEAVVFEKGRESSHDLRKVGCVIDLFLIHRFRWVDECNRVGRTDLGYASEGSTKGGQLGAPCWLDKAAKFRDFVEGTDHSVVPPV